MSVSQLPNVEAVDKAIINSAPMPNNPVTGEDNGNWWRWNALDQAWEDSGAKINPDGADVSYTKGESDRKYIQVGFEKPTGIANIGAKYQVVNAPMPVSPLVQFSNGKAGDSAVVEVVANENLFVGTSDVEKSTTTNLLKNIQVSDNFEGKTLTASAYIRALTTAAGVRIICSNGAISADESNRLLTVYSDNKSEACTVTFEVPANTTVISLYLSQGSSVDGLHKNVKLEYGSKATPWIPNPADGVEIPTYQLTRCGKNLVQINDYSLENTTVGFHARKKVQPYMPLAEYDTINNYSLSADVISTIVHNSSYVFDAYLGNIVTKGGELTDAFLNKKAKAYVSTKFKGQINPSNGLYNTNLIGVIGKVDVSNIQIELGNTATDYKPYSGETITIQPNTPTLVPLLDGINTFFTDEGVDLTVSYTPQGTGDIYEFNGESWELYSADKTAQTLQAIQKMITGGTP